MSDDVRSKSPGLNVLVTLVDFPARSAPHGTIQDWPCAQNSVNSLRRGRIRDKVPQESCRHLPGRFPNLYPPGINSRRINAFEDMQDEPAGANQTVHLVFNRPAFVLHSTPSWSENSWSGRNHALPGQRMVSTSAGMEFG